MYLQMQQKRVAIQLVLLLKKKKHLIPAITNSVIVQNWMRKAMCLVRRVYFFGKATVFLLNTI